MGDEVKLDHLARRRSIPSHLAGSSRYSAWIDLVASAEISWSKLGSKAPASFLSRLGFASPMDILEIEISKSHCAKCKETTPLSGPCLEKVQQYGGEKKKEHSIWKYPTPPSHRRRLTFFCPSRPGSLGCRCASSGPQWHVVTHRCGPLLRASTRPTIFTILHEEDSQRRIRSILAQGLGISP